MKPIGTDGPSHAVDAVTRDACEAVSKRGGIPDTQGIRSFVQGVVERLDRKRADAPPKPKRKPEQRAHGARKAPTEIVREAKRRLAWRGLEPIVDYDEVEIARRPISSEELFKSKPKPKPSGGGLSPYAIDMLIKRIRLIRSTEDYRMRGETINPLALTGELGPAKKTEAINHWKQLIVDSEKHFGPWWKAPPERLFFT